MPTCAVVSCENGSRILAKWKLARCGIHKCVNLTGNCYCDPPFRLLKFPSDPAILTVWLQNINRKLLESGEDWQPTKNSRICSQHFVDQKPTPENPNPTLRLGSSRTWSQLKTQHECLQTPQHPPDNKSPPPDDEPPQKKTKHESFLKDVPADSNGEIITDNSIFVPLIDIICKSEFKGTSHQPSTATPVNVEHSYSVPVNCLHTMACKSCPGCAKTRPEDLICVGEHSCCCRVKCDFSRDIMCKECVTKDMIIEDLRREVKELKSKVRCKSKMYMYSTRTAKKSRPGACVSSVIMKNKQSVQFYTGLPNKAILNLVFDFIKPKLEETKQLRRSKTDKTPVYTSKKTRASALTTKQRFLMVLMKLKLGLVNRDLAGRFGVPLSNVSHIFTSWLKALSIILEPLIRFPFKENINAKVLKFYPRCRAILDCPEIDLEIPRKRELQIQTWSNCKKRNTAKFLLGITPRGSICYLSKCWGGRATDQHIIQNSGFLLEPHDEYLRDRGCQNSGDRIRHNTRPVSPPEIRGTAHAAGEGNKTTKKAKNLRMHVKKAFGRMKCFRILKYVVPVSLLPLIDDIATVCAALCNLQSPLVN